MSFALRDKSKRHLLLLQASLTQKTLTRGEPCLHAEDEAVVMIEVMGSTSQILMEQQRRENSNSAYVHTIDLAVAVVAYTYGVH